MQAIDITDYIPRGRKNAVKLKQLSARLHLTDRDVRRLISEARQDITILNFQDGNGYFLPDTDEIDLIEAWLRQEENRIKNLKLSLKAAKKVRKGLGA